MRYAHHRVCVYLRDGKRFIYFSPTEMRALLFLDNPPPPSPTGGVRCERAGSYLRALSESGAGAWRDKEPPRGIYQLRGGIQAYLEAYGVKRSGGGSATSEILEEDGGDGNNGDRSASTSTDRSATKPCLYRGKNFVFDPRRTDPVVGDGITCDVAEASRAGYRVRVSLVGRCLMCANPHDDYDNGRAPCEEREARCCRCRVLILVCDTCRLGVRCWGEPPRSGDDDRKKDIFCGGSGAQCVDDGNVAENVEIARY